MEIQYFKNFKFTEQPHEVKQDGVPVGVIEGYLATWDVDRGKDQFVKGAFEMSLSRYRNEARPIRMKGFHKKIIGKFPIENVYEDDKGLHVRGEINLEVQEGREIYALAKQGALSDMSIGYSVVDVEIENGIRKIKEAEIWEGSIVDEPMNPRAQINEVKAVNSLNNLPKEYADKSYKWNGTEAEKRVREWAGGEPNDKYKKAFLYWQGEGENVTDYKLGIADIVDGGLKIVPRAVVAVRAVLAGARGGVDIPQADKEKIKNIIVKLYSDMGMDEPFTDGKSNVFTIAELKLLKKSILFDVVQEHKISKRAVEILFSGLDEVETFQSPSDKESLLKSLNEVEKIFKKEG